MFVLQSYGNIISEKIGQMQQNLKKIKFFDIIISGDEKNEKY